MRLDRCLLFAGVAALFTGCKPPLEPRAANVLVVTLDTTRADRIGAFGGTAVPTPRLDAIAKQGTKFTQTISTNPLTLPAHSSLFTGRYPFHHGVRHNGAYSLPQSEVTLAERLGKAGFRTAAFVGAFVLDKSFGLDQGFEAYDGVESRTASANFLRPSSLQRSGQEVNRSFFQWVDSLHDARFFAWVHYYDPHLPYAPPEAPGVRLEGSGYDREISYVDHCFGELVDHLSKRGLLDRTLVVVVGDHGESLGSHKEKAHGLFLYESVLHVPMFMRLPGMVPSGETYASPVSLVDVSPSILTLLGVQTEAGDGRSLFSAPRKLAREDRSRLTYAETWMPRVELGWSDLAMVRGERFKYIQAPKPELYDVSSDPAEAVNLVDVDRDVAGELRESLSVLVASGAAASASAANTLTAEELAKLQSLGYLRGGSTAPGDADPRTLADPKDHVEEAVALEEAEESLERNELAPALAGFERVLRENAGNHAALGGRTRVLLRQSKLREAEDAAERALAAAAADPKTPQTVADNARGLLATILSLEGRPKEAEAYLRATLHGGGDEAEHRSPVAVLLAAAKNRDEARIIVDLAVQLRPADPWSWAARLDYARMVGDRPAIDAAAARIVTLGPQGAAALVDVGKSAQDAGDPGLAVALFEAASRAMPDHPDVLGYLGTALIAAGDLVRAEHAFDRVRELRPRDPRAPMYLANIALLRNDEAKARALIDASLRAYPDFVPPLLNYARWLAEKGRTAEAIRAVESALKRRPGDAAAQALLTQVRSGSVVAGQSP